ncbi:type VI secretion system protein ImpA [Rhodobacter aestuarii]|uniref:Type VI secretion system protein ImpA n=1 Tax=Rhodobacter aestuarii TaxID=453582 RepID=A0A1N7JVB3_9RHOB|nr:type VI secretion system ImpA family N-terminal domain-containing protein [Rhodobacter aestuarii]PTV95975.1 type VI secretion system protein ImpA [Rhodobacter aestuarii]SIS53273.1 type VI secretion system protein ImpA [Rhodobacter aestuarii]
MDWLTDPISDEAPCGPDLEKTGDAEFIEYYFAAESELPERYLMPQVFDPASIDYRKESTKIEALLKRSRDLRLLSLLARFAILSGRVKEFAQALESMVALLETWPEAAHPALPARGSARRVALDCLSSTPWVVMPIQYLPLNGMAEVTLRRHQVATGEASARDGEETSTAAQIMDMLRSPGNSAKAAATQEALSRAAAALTKIADICTKIPAKQMQLDFARPLAAIAQAQELIASADPTLAVWAGDAAAPETEAEPASTETAAGAPEVILRAPSVSGASSAPAIESMAQVKVVLSALEAHLARTEPSSVALLLVTQARLLIGKSLVEALETLLPAEASKATVDFGPASGFSLSMDRLKALASETTETAETDTLSPPQAPSLRNRADIAAQMRAVEAWYRTNEPTSPIPLLLTRARNSLDKDFEALVTELLSKRET